MSDALLGKYKYEMNSGVKKQQISLQHIYKMKFSTSAIASILIASVAQAAVIPADEIFKRDQGMLGDLCDQVTQRFNKLGVCISSMPQYQALDGNFWFQAAKKELCGYPMNLPGNLSGLNVPTAKLFLASAALLTNELNAQNSASCKVGEAPTQYHYHDGEQKFNVTSSCGKTVNHDDVDLELKAQYLYSLSTSTDTFTYESDDNNSTEKREFIESLQKRAGVTLPILSELQCLNACDVIRRGSNAVDNCWQVSGLTVLYGVCQVGCRYYL